MSLKLLVAPGITRQIGKVTFSWGCKLSCKLMSTHLPRWQTTYLNKSVVNPVTLSHWHGGKESKVVISKAELSRGLERKWICSIPPSSCLPVATRLKLSGLDSTRVGSLVTRDTSANLDDSSGSFVVYSLRFTWALSKFHVARPGYVCSENWKLTIIHIEMKSWDRGNPPWEIW